MDSALDWTSDDEFAIDGISYVCRGVKVGMKSTEARAVIDPASFDVSTSYGRVGRELMRNLNRPWSDVEPDPSDAIT
jgi:hypothetical protein